MKPLVGNKVFYVSRDTGKTCLAWIVDVDVYPDSLLARQPCDADPQDEGYYDVALKVYFRSGEVFIQQARFSLEPQPGRWSWER